MTRRNRILFVTVCVIVGLIVVVSVALRLILTRDRLMALVVPRIERRIGAEIDFGDIGIRFPFGFGVDVDDLKFEKTLPDGSRADVSAGRVTVRASLLSLIRRKPDIKAIDVTDADVKLTGIRGGTDIALEGVKSTISMKPTPRGFSITERAEIGAITVTRGEAALPLGTVMVTGDLDAPADLNSFIIRELQVRWADMLSARLAGEVKELSGERTFSISVRCDDFDIAALLHWMKGMPLGEFDPRLGSAQLREGLPVELTGGTVSIDVSAAGSAKDPGGIEARGTVTLNELSFRHPLLKGEARISGDIELSEKDIRTRNASASFGGSRVSLGLDIDVSEQRKPERISFKSESEVLLDDLEIDIAGGGSASGKVLVRMEGWGTPETISGLFPAAGKGVSPERINDSWKRFALEGTVQATEVNISSADMPMAVSSLTAEAEVQHGDIKRFKTDFTLDGSPYSCKGSMLGIMPALAELAAVGEKMGRGEGPQSLADALDGVHNAPSINLDITGKTLDVRRFQQLRRAQREGTGGETEETGSQRTSRQVVPAYNPASAVLLKSTSFFVRVDSIVTEKAAFTALYAKGNVSDGRMTVNPLLLNYAGGVGRGSLRVDFRDSPDVETKVNLSFEGISAGKALADFSKFGRIIDGTFTVKANTEFMSGPGVNTPMSVNATGSTVSSNGRIDISSLVAPLKGSAPLDLTPIEKFDFREWSGNFVVVDGRLRTDDWKIESSKADWLIKGSYGLDGTLDFGIRLAVPPAVQKQMKDLHKYGDLVNLLKDAQGNLVLDFHLGGTTKAPKISLDTSKAEQKAGDKLIDEFMKKAKDLLK